MEAVEVFSGRIKARGYGELWNNCRPGVAQFSSCDDLRVGKYAGCSRLPPSWFFGSEATPTYPPSRYFFWEGRILSYFGDRLGPSDGQCHENAEICSGSSLRFRHRWASDGRR